ncbi:MAG TPA: hypothetical protein VKT82_27335 [Ktedonobacterales bacterium]|nr:hypothetical protein [Ktedonobacterales bacterium]
MRTRRSVWYTGIGVLGLILLLAACSPASGNTPNSTTTPVAASTPSPAENTTLPASIVSFTASGGLTGAYTISDQDASSTVSASATGHALNITVRDQRWNFVLGYTPYTGPGTYTAGYAAGSTSTGGISLVSADNTKIWRLLPPASCSLTIASDTALTVGRTTYHDIKGSFSCASVASVSSNTIPLTISNGQFDVIAQEP